MVSFHANLKLWRNQERQDSRESERAFSMLR